MAKFTLHQPNLAPAVEPEIDPAALEAFAAGARERQVADGELPPWEQFDPSEKPRYNVAIRLNDYQLAMLRYLAEARDTSQHKLLQRHLIPILKQLALEEFESNRVKPS
ncbi:MAG: hypothetical protein WAV07_16365 [Candidatus Contendobacter sp.]